MQVAERGQHLDGVGQRHRQRQRLAELAPFQQDLLERLAADVLHHDVAGHLAGAPVGVLDEVVDADDVRMLHLGQEPAFGQRGFLGGRVAAVQQALEDHPPVRPGAGPCPGRSSPARRGPGSRAPRTGRRPARRRPAWARRRTGCRSAGSTPRSARAARPGPGRPGARTSRRTACSPAPAGWPGSRRPDHGPAPAGCPPARRRAGRGRTGCCRAGTAGCRTAPTPTRCRCCRTPGDPATLGGPAAPAGPTARTHGPDPAGPDPRPGPATAAGGTAGRRAPGRGRPARGASPHTVQ